jgi:hypothetical protein
MAMPKECFCFDFVWYSMWYHYFEVAAGTTISCSLDRWYSPVFSLSFLDVYEFYLGFGYQGRMSPVLLYIMGCIHLGF